MNLEEKLMVLEELFDEEQGTLKPETELETLIWDSMKKLSLIAEFNYSFGKTLTGDQIREFQTIGDILSAME